MKTYSVRFSPHRDGNYHEPLKLQGHSIKHCRGIASGLAFGGYDSEIINYFTKEVVETNKSEWSTIS